MLIASEFGWTLEQIDASDWEDLSITWALLNGYRKGVQDGSD